MFKRSYLLKAIFMGAVFVLPAGVIAAVTVEKPMAVYSSPVTQASRVTTLSKGEGVHINGCFADKSWCSIEYKGGAIGFVRGDNFSAATLGAVTTLSKEQTLKDTARSVVNGLVPENILPKFGNEGKELTPSVIDAKEKLKNDLDIPAKTPALSAPVKEQTSDTAKTKVYKNAPIARSQVPLAVTPAVQTSVVANRSALSFAKLPEGVATRNVAVSARQPVVLASKVKPESLHKRDLHEKRSEAKVHALSAHPVVDVRSYALSPSAHCGKRYDRKNNGISRKECRETVKRAALIRPYRTTGSQDYVAVIYQKATSDNPPSVKVVTAYNPLFPSKQPDRDYDVNEHRYIVVTR
ncbi:SH3 domain-containing protein [Bartonella sp. DGB2]|uniref:SH3 domain-containing protein n=1 Tax=Bartonella sp. DGB2 TaxID=3388426 RepID=UPI0039901C5E